MVNKYTYEPICPKQTLEQLYASNMSQVEMAEELKTSQHKIWGDMKKFGIKTRPRIKRNQFGENNDSWKGGRAKHPRGYIYILSKKHPRAGKFGYVFEHILIMEKFLGRFLKDDEIVHHINGDRCDNRIENLKLTTPALHFEEHGRTPEGYMKKIQGVKSDV